MNADLINHNLCRSNHAALTATDTANTGPTYRTKNNKINKTISNANLLMSAGLNATIIDMTTNAINGGSDQIIEYCHKRAGLKATNAVAIRATVFFTFANRNK